MALIRHEIISCRHLAYSIVVDAHIILFCLVFCFGFVCRCNAQTRGSLSGDTADTLTFDTATVTALTASVEKPGNLATLEVKYFGDRTVHPCPTSQGLTIAENAAAKATVGSRRWFCLQTLCGYAGYTVSMDTRDQGQQAYDTIFTHAADAERSSCVDVAVQAINDYLVLLGSNYGLKAQHGLQGLKKTTLDAYIEYSSFIGSGSSFRRNVEWTDAVKGTFIYYDASNIVGKMLARRSSGNSFLTYKLAADTYAVKDMGKAAEMYAAAKTYIDEASDQQRDAYYGDYVTDLVAQGDIAKAITVQQELLSVTGTGRARLLMLCWQTGDSTDYSKTLSELEGSQVSEEDVQGAALILANIFDNSSASPAHTQEIELLKDYINSSRERTPKYELWARYTLARLYIADKNLAAAAVALKLPPDLRALRSPIALRYIDEIDGLSASLK